MGRGTEDTDSGFGSKSVDELIAEYKKMILGGKAIFPLAADNLEHWLGNTGKKRNLPLEPFKKDSKIINHLVEKHRAIFLSQEDKTKGIILRIKKSPGVRSRIW